MGSGTVMAAARDPEAAAAGSGFSARHGVSWLSVGVLIAALLAALLLADRRPEAAGASWGANDRLQVAAVSVDGDGNPKAVTFTWPAPTGTVDTFELRRGGTPVATVGAGALSATDDTPDAGTSAQSYSVAAIVGGADDARLGAPDVRFPDPATGCTLLWTGSADSSWDDARNWAPYGVLGSEGPVRAPTDSDHVCVDHPLNTPIVVDSAGNAAGRFTGTWYRPETLRVTPGDLKIFGPATIPALQMAGGTLQLLDDSKLLWAAGRPELRLGGGELIIDTKLDVISDITGQINGEIQADDGTTTTITGGEINVQRVEFDKGRTKTIVGQGGHTLNVQTDLDLTGDTTMSVGTGGATLVASGVEIDSGRATIGWAVDGDPSNGLFINSDGGRLVLDDLAGLGAGDTQLEDTRIDLRGEVALGEPLEVLGGSLDVQNAAASLTSGGSSTPYAGLRQAEALYVDNGAIVDIDGDLAVDELDLIRGAEVYIAGALRDAPPDFDYVGVDDALLSIGLPSTLPRTSILEIGEQAKIFGDITAEGEIIAAETVDAVGYSDGIFYDDLTLHDTSTLRLGADGTGTDDASGLRVEGQLTVDGELDIDVAAVLPDGTDLTLVETTQPPLGTFDTITTRGSGSTDTRGEVKDDGIHLTAGGGGPGPTCATNLPSVGTMPVKGCWIERAAESVWVSYDAVIVGPTDVPSIGGLAFDPQAGVELVLDLTDPARGLLFGDEGGRTGDVGVELLVERAGTTESADLGIFGLDWTLDGGANPISPPEFLGMPVDAADVALDQTWELGVDVVLPGVLDAGQVSLDLVDTGRGITDRVQGRVTTSLAGVASFADLDLAYTGAESWLLASTSSDGAQLAGALDYASGALQVGSLDISDVSIGGFAVPDAVLAWNPGTTTWTSDVLAPDAQPALRLVESGVGAIAEGSRIALDTTELGIATVREGTELVRGAAEWQLDGTIDIVEGIRDISSTGLRFVDGVLVEGNIALVGSVGQLAELRSLELTLPPTTVPDPGLDKAAVLYDVSTRIVSGGIDVVRTGSVALLDGSVEALELPLEAALGGLGELNGVLRYDPTTGEFPFTGADPLAKAQFVCNGTATDAFSDAVFVGGAPTSGALGITELCFGPFVLDDVALEYNAARRTYDVTGDVDGQPVTGDLGIEGGDVTRGEIGLPEIDLGGWISFPPVTLTHTDTGRGDEFGLGGAPIPGDLLRSFGLVFDDGRLVAGALGLGDVLGSDLADLVADAKGLLPIGGIDLAYDEPRQTWTVTGFLDEPATAFSGSFRIDDGRLASGSLLFDDVRLGSLAALDLRLDVAGPTSFDVTGTLQGDAFDGARSATGSFTFGGGVLIGGQLLIPEFPIGDLIQLEDLRFTASPTGWTIGGSAVSDAGDSTLSGSATFDEGELIAATLDIEQFPLGPSVVDRLGFVFDRSTGPDAYVVEGLVRGPATGPSGGGGDATLVEFTGSATIADGELLGFAATVPYLEIGSLAYLENISLSYLDQSGDMTLFATGAVVTADDTDASVATMLAVVEDGRVQRAEVTAGRLSLGGLLTIDDFMMTYGRNSGATCQGSGGRGAVYTFSGTSAANETVSGCVALAGRTLIGAELTADRLSVGELFEIENLDARFRQVSTYNVELTSPRGAKIPGGAELSRTALEFTADIRAGSLAPVNVDGALGFTDGGLSELSLDVPRLPLSATVELVDIEIDYQQPGRWDGVSDTSFALSGTAEHDGGSTSASGSLGFTADGVLNAARLSVDDLPLGPLTIDRFELLFDGGQATRWEIDGEITPPGGTTAVFDGSATIDDGRITDAAFDIGGVSIGELVLLDKAGFEFERNPNGSERWQADAEVLGLGQRTDPATAAIEVIIAADGSLESGSVQVTHVMWGGLLRVDDLSLVGRSTGPQFEWNVAGQVRVGDGTTTALTGQLVLSDGVVQSGSLSMSGLQIDQFAHIDQLDLAANRSGGLTTWAADLLVTPVGDGQVAASGEMTWLLGRLDSARLELGDVQIAELFELESLEIQLDTGRRWAVLGRLVDDDGVTGIGGSLVFTAGELTSGQLQLTDLQLGPITLSELDLIVDSTGASTSNICGVPDLGGAGSVYGVQATVASADGDTTSLAGRLRLQPGAFTDGVLCGDSIQVADMILLDDLLISYSQMGSGFQRTVQFDGTATVANPDDPTDTASASVGFGIRDRRLQRFDLSAGGLELGELLTLGNVELHFDRSTDAANWNFAADLVRPGPDDTQLTGALRVDDGVIVGGSLQAADLPIGDLFTFTDLQIEFRGRRATTDPGALNPWVSAGATTDCAAVPNDDNVPGSGAATGGESVFLVSADVAANGDSFAVRGSMSLADGRLTSFDVTLACLPLGDFKTLEALRIGYREDRFLASARLQDEEGTSTAGGRLFFDDGRLTGGELRIADLPLGIVSIDELEIALGENVNGDTTFGLTLTVEDDDGTEYGGGGSLTMRDGNMVAGSLQISEMPFLGLFTIEDFAISFDGSVPNRTAFAGGARVQLGGGATAGMDISMTFEDGRLIQGSFNAQQIDLFEVIPLGGFSITFDSVNRSWSGSMDVTLPGSGGAGPGLQIGVEFQRGKLVSGLFGFDGNGDGEVDGLDGNDNPPASGGGDFAGLPLKALYIEYCAPNSTATFCSPIDAGAWQGRIAFELPTDSAPGLDASIRIRNGRFEYASVEIDNLGIPIYPGVFLERIAALVELNPRLRFAGGIGVSVGVGAFDVVDIDADFQFSEEPEPDPGQSPESYEPEYLRFYTIGRATFLDLPIQLRSWVDIRTFGFVGVGGRLRVDLIGENTLYVEGRSEGWVIFDAADMNLRNPRTNALLSGPTAQVSGSVEARIIGVQIASAEFVANPIGAMGCAGVNVIVKEVRVGAGIYWADGSTRLSCDMGDFAIAGVETGEPIFPEGGRFVEAAVTEFATFDVPAGEPVLGVEVEGIGGTPDAVLVAPDGTIYDLVDNDVDAGVIVHDSEGKRWFVIGSPPAGEWQVVASPTSVPLGEVRISVALPDVDVTGTVGQSSSGFALDYELTEIEGQQVVFVERSADPDDEYTAVVGGATGTSGRIIFTPGGAVTGGERELVALVYQDGFVRDEVVLDTFTVPDASLASAPIGLGVEEVVSGARVTWEPPTSNGGREITSYRISSSAGWSVTTGPDERSAFLPIPGLVPGEAVPVIVEARTGAGLGEPATVFFTSSQTTAFQYGQGDIPEAVLTRPLPDGNPPPTTVPTTAPPTTAPPSDGGGPTTNPTPPILPTTGGGSSSLPHLAIVLILVGAACLVAVRGTRRSDTAS